MAVAPTLPVVPVEEYLNTSYPDGDREYLDGIVVERNLGTLGQSRLQKLIIVHLAQFEKQLQFETLPECRTRINETRYRVPDVLALLRPHQSAKLVVDVPFLIIEILSPDDRMRDTMQRFREYQRLGVKHVIQMDPEERITHVFEDGALYQRDLTEIDVPGRGSLPFDSRELLTQLDEA